MKDRINRGWAVAFLALVGGLGASVATIHATGLRVNLTDSLPKGIYRVTDAQPSRGDLLAFCPDHRNPTIALARERGYLTESAGCGTGLAPMFKRLVATTGDVVSITDTGITVNGVVLENTKRLQRDGNGEALPRPTIERVTVGPDLALVVSTYAPNSYDGRYFGFITKDQIIGRVTPVLTWE